MAGVALPEGTRTLLFVGSHGIGPWCYGTGGPGGTCDDPVAQPRGGHAYPYVHQIWAYDMRDIVKVRRSHKSPWSPEPYGIWRFDLPFQNGGRRISGVAYDPAANRLYLAQWRGDGELPLIQVFDVACQGCPHRAKE
jgi:hypothetical protein